MALPMARRYWLVSTSWKKAQYGSLAASERGSTWNLKKRASLAFQSRRTLWARISVPSGVAWMTREAGSLQRMSARVLKAENSASNASVTIRSRLNMEKLCSDPLLEKRYGCGRDKNVSLTELPSDRAANTLC